MTSVAPGPFPLPGVGSECWLVKFDRQGTCISPATRAALVDRLAQADGAPVILFSHGWNNDFAFATDLYAGFLAQLEPLLAKHFPGRQAPLFVGVIWPSILLSSNQGPAIAGGPSAADDTDQAQTEEIALALPGAEEREDFYRLIERPLLDEGEAARLARLISAALGEQSGGGAPEGAELAEPGAAAVLAGLKALQELEAPPDEEYSEEGGVIGGPAAGAPQDAGLLDYLDPRWAVRLASVYQMKDRAGTVGWKGVAPLVSDILGRTARRLHLVGHSYGAKVVLSALAGSAAAREAESVLLLQPAISHLSFAARLPGGAGAGGYHSVPGRVHRSILATFSGRDIPLHSIFHRALRREADLGEARIAAAATAAGDPPNVYAAMGGYGPRGAGERLIDGLPKPGEPVPYAREKCIAAFDGTKGPQISGHGDVTTPYTAWLLASQIEAGNDHV